MCWAKASFLSIYVVKVVHLDQQRVTLIKKSEKKRIVSEYINEGLVMQPTQM